MAHDEKHDRSGASDRLDRIIGGRLGAASDRGGAQCPDGSIIVAYHERALRAAERARWERHFAQCARCTGAIAAFARIDEAVEVRDGSNRRSAAEGNGSWWRPRVAIPVAAFGAALAVMIVVAIRSVRPGGVAGMNGGNSLVAMNETVRAQPTRESMARTVVRPATAESDTAPSETATAAAPAAASGVAPMPPPTASPEQATVVPRNWELESARGALLSPNGVGAADLTGAANRVEVEGPNHAAAWMIGARGAISHYSSVAGWIPQTSGVTVDLIAGSAPSATICWVVGRRGTILRTVDGAHWTKVVGPVSDDLVSVVAIGAGNATIATGSGLRFSTADGGANWRLLK